MFEGGVDLPESGFAGLEGEVGGGAGGAVGVDFDEFGAQAAVVRGEAFGVAADDLDAGVIASKIDADGGGAAFVAHEGVAGELDPEAVEAGPSEPILGPSGAEVGGGGEDLSEAVLPGDEDGMVFGTLENNLGSFAGFQFKVAFKLGSGGEVDAIDGGVGAGEGDGEGVFVEAGLDEALGFLDE